METPANLLIIARNLLDLVTLAVEIPVIYRKSDKSPKITGVIGVTHRLEWTIHCHKAPTNLMTYRFSFQLLKQAPVKLL